MDCSISDQFFMFSCLPFQNEGKTSTTKIQKFLSGHSREYAKDDIGQHCGDWFFLNQSLFIRLTEKKGLNFNLLQYFILKDWLHVPHNVHVSYWGYIASGSPLLHLLIWNYELYRQIQNIY